MVTYYVKDFLPFAATGDTIIFDCDVEFADGVTFEDTTFEGDTAIGDAVGDTLTLTATMASSIKLYPIGTGALASASGLLMGVGTSAKPATTSTADAKFVEIRAQTTATSGDNRLMYLRYDINGATGGECIRAFTKVTAATTTVRGAHLSLDLDATGTVSGIGVGVDAQIMLGDASYASNLAVINSEIYSGGTSSDISGVVSFMRCVFTGNATGSAAVEDEVNLLSLINGSVASGNLVEAEDDETKFSHKIRINIYGTESWIMCTQS